MKLRTVLPPEVFIAVFLWMFGSYLGQSDEPVKNDVEVIEPEQVKEEK